MSDACVTCGGSIDRAARPRSRWCSDLCKWRATSRSRYADPATRAGMLARQAAAKAEKYANDWEFRERIKTTNRDRYRNAHGTAGRGLPSSASNDALALQKPLRRTELRPD